VHYAFGVIFNAISAVRLTSNGHEAAIKHLLTGGKKCQITPPLSPWWEKMGRFNSNRHCFIWILLKSYSGQVLIKRRPSPDQTQAKRRANTGISCIRSINGLYYFFI